MPSMILAFKDFALCVVLTFLLMVAVLGGPMENPRPPVERPAFTAPNTPNPEEETVPSLLDLLLDGEDICYCLLKRGHIPCLPCQGRAASREAHWVDELGVGE